MLISIIYVYLMFKFSENMQVEVINTYKLWNEGGNTSAHTYIFITIVYVLAVGLCLGMLFSVFISQCIQFPICVPKSFHYVSAFYHNCYFIHSILISSEILRFSYSSNKPFYLCTFLSLLRFHSNATCPAICSRTAFVIAHTLPISIYLSNHSYKVEDSHALYLYFFLLFSNFLQIINSIINGPYSPIRMTL